MKSQVDEYTVSSPHRVSSRITVYCSTEAAEPLHYPIQLEGIECEIKEIYINLDIGNIILAVVLNDNLSANHILCRLIA